MTNTTKPLSDWAATTAKDFMADLTDTVSRQIKNGALVDGSPIKAGTTRYRITAPHLFQVIKGKIEEVQLNFNGIGTFMFVWDDSIRDFRAKKIS